jgi:hypothetical protein
LRFARELVTDDHADARQRRARARIERSSPSLTDDDFPFAGDD